MYAEPSLRNFHLAHPGANKLKTGEDLLIAASAIAEHAVIVTFNVADFMKIDQAFALTGLYDPGADAWPIAPRSKLTIRNDRSRNSWLGPIKRPPKHRRSDPNWSRVAVAS